MIETIREVTMTEVMAFREEKAAIWKLLSKEYEKETIISFGLNIPGSIKVTEQIIQAFVYGMKYIEAVFHDMEVVIYRKKEQRSFAGYSVSYALAGSNARELKKKMVEIEENHPLGRIFDIDVMGKEGSISRREVGGLPRKCLLCEEEAKICSRSVAHSQEAVRQKMEKMIHQYIRKGV
ncbi:holo-ACP synthase [Aequitasia blattaphilus]|uniref:citrate lyase holo-[acyl-carrier protein] synthase n=1 Tax=Aequitasia blattaphilus TaxID=2949332 RepID=A0ABT1E968_9FIRM|nr:citrate lyase holo-[acyl-carrier protein] synthase [Aequitasia blattaphilus]MCP1102375.1 citrate lyase holo-[acyl-carrier protein] synthase [Aequitasia blattaphilus]MCR8615015.1 citrate lyase holo-[acyl-carrier protein] synthase [Aequitasia blattaphilus]